MTSMMKSFSCATTCNLTRWHSATQKMFCSSMLLILLTAMTGQNVMAQPPVYVNVSAKGLNDGTSWENACNSAGSLQRVITSTESGCQIRVAEGGNYLNEINI